MLTKGLVEQYPVKFATIIYKSDFALFVNGKASSENNITSRGLESPGVQIIQ